MWFRNLQIYRLPVPWAITAEQLAEKLAARPFQPCGSQDMVSRGWSSPTKDGRFVLAVGGHYLVSLVIEQKLLPGSVVNEVAADKAEEIEAQQGFKPGRKQMKEIKEAVRLELLPKAFTRTIKLHAWIDPTGGILAIDTASLAHAETLLDALRSDLESLPVALLKTQLAPVALMTTWLATGDGSASFTIDQDCELRATDGARIRYVSKLLDGQDVQGHLAAGMRATHLALTFDDRISFIITEKLEIKRLAFLDVIKEEAERQADAADMQMEADFSLMTGELSRLIPALLEVLGGEVKEVV